MGRCGLALDADPTGRGRCLSVVRISHSWRCCPGCSGTTIQSPFSGLNAGGANRYNRDCYGTWYPGTRPHRSACSEAEPTPQCHRRCLAKACSRPRCRRPPGVFRDSVRQWRRAVRGDDGLRGRSPRLVEWKGPHRPPGDDVIPADIRIDHVYQVSCKYLSRVMQNCGPARLFDRLLVGEERTGRNWFTTVAPDEYQVFYADIRAHVGGDASCAGGEPKCCYRAVLKAALRSRVLPTPVQQSWESFCSAVSVNSARRWEASLDSPRKRLRLLWRLLRIADAPYFVLGVIEELTYVLGSPQRGIGYSPMSFKRWRSHQDLRASPR